MPCFPGSGLERERGAFNNIINVPLAPGAESDDFRDAFGFMRPAMKTFAPDLVLISAGFDAHGADPLAEVNLDEDDFAWVTEQLVEIAKVSAGGRIVSVLEGGYDLRALGRSVQAHVKALMQA
jgi:acetoin utilization deacetylase AcuC-like enzyme